MKSDYKNDITMDPIGFILLADFVPNIVQDIRYYSTHNSIGKMIDGYAESCALLKKEAAQSLKAVSTRFLSKDIASKSSTPTAGPAL